MARGTQPAFSKDGKLVAYVRDGSAFVAPPGGGAERRLTRGKMIDVRLAAGAGGFLLTGNGCLWSAAPGADEQLVLRNEGMGAGTGGLEYFVDLAVSPDGARVVLVSSGGQDAGGAPSSLLLANRDGSGKRALGPGRQPSWSPDGQRFVFSRKGDLFVYGVRDGTTRQLTKRRTASHAWPAWAPAGGVLAFSAICADTTGDGKVNWKDAPEVFALAVGGGPGVGARGGDATPAVESVGDLVSRVTLGAAPARSRFPLRGLICEETSKPPVLDGVLDDPCWRHARIATDFWLLRSRRAASLQTRVRAAFDDRALYLAYECLDPNVGGIQATVATHDDGMVWKDDIVELFLDPPRARRACYQWMINSLGTVWDARHVFESVPGADQPLIKTDLSWESGATVGTRRCDDRWTVEARVPFEAMPEARSAGRKPWAVNFNRHQIAADETSSWSRLSGLRGNFDIEYFGNLLFGNIPVLIEEWLPGTSRLGTNQLTVTVRNRAARPAHVKLQAIVNEAPGALTDLHIPSGAAENAVLTYSVASPGPGKLQVRLLDADAGRVLGVETAGFTPPPAVLCRPVSKAFMAGAGDARATVRLAVGPLTLPAIRVVAELLASDSAVLRRQTISRLTSPNLTLHLNVAGLGRGAYTLVCRVVGPSGNTLGESRGRVRVVSNPFDF